MIALIGLCAFFSIALLVMALGGQLSLGPAQMSSRIEAIANRGAAPAYDPRVARLLRMQSYSRWGWLQRRLEGTRRAEQIGESLDRAGMRLTVGQYVALRVVIGLALAFATFAWLPAGALLPLIAPAAFVMGLYIPRWYVKRRIRRRRAQFEALLPDALAMFSRSLRAGSGLLIAIENMIEQANGPIEAEFTRLKEEIGAGLSIEEAFRELDRRMASRDLHIAVTAILIQREVGGNLSEILDNIAGMMRARVKLRGEVKSLISRQVYSTYIMAAVPPVMALILFVLAPTLIMPLLQNQVGWLVIGLAAALEIIGFLVVKRIGSSPLEV